MNRGQLIAHNGANIFGGGEIWTALLLQGLQKRGHRVLLYCNSDIVMERARTYDIPVAKAPLGGDVVFTHPVLLAAKLRRHKPDVVLFTTYKKIWLGVMATQLARVPRTIVRVGLSTDTPRSLKYRIALRYVDDVVVNSPDIAPAFGGRAITIPDGVATLPFTQDLREQFPANAFIIGTAARLSEQKRVDRLIDAVCLLPDNVYALIAGDGTDRHQLENHARARGVADRVRFLGHRDDVGNVINALDVYVITSDREGLANAMLEAMALSKPVVSTPVSGATHALRGCGIVLNGFNAGEVAAAIRQLMNNSEEQARLGAAARQKYLAEFQFGTMLDKWERVLFAPW